MEFDSFAGWLCHSSWR